MSCFCCLIYVANYLASPISIPIFVWLLFLTSSARLKAADSWEPAPHHGGHFRPVCRYSGKSLHLFSPGVYEDSWTMTIPDTARCEPGGAASSYHGVMPWPRFMSYIPKFGMYFLLLWMSCTNCACICKKRWKSFLHSFWLGCVPFLTECCCKKLEYKSRCTVCPPICFVRCDNGIFLYVPVAWSYWLALNDLVSIVMNWRPYCRHLVCNIVRNMPGARSCTDLPKRFFFLYLYMVLSPVLVCIVDALVLRAVFLLRLASAA